MFEYFIKNGVTRYSKLITDRQHQVNKEYIEQNIPQIVDTLSPRSKRMNKLYTNNVLNNNN